MFYFAPSDRYFADEVRERVHDSDGLLICNGKGEQIWRPLRNPPRIQFSTFLDRGPRGFGLVQRERRPERFQDFDARYEDRPSAWVEPLDDWGEGSVDLVELPTANEYADNIVAYWRPKEDMGPGRSYRFRYRLTWTNGLSPTPGIATVFQTLVGASTMHPQMRLFYIDFQGTETFELCDWSSENCGDKLQNLELNASAGSIVNVALRKNPIAGGHRLGFEFDPPTDRIEADLRCALVLDKKPISEVWIYRWTR
jgi:glucans biosynthesis protein